MSSASRGSGTRRRMKLRNRDCSRLTTSEIRWSCSSAIRSAIRTTLAVSFTYSCRRMRAADIVGSLSSHERIAGVRPLLSGSERRVAHPRVFCKGGREDGGPLSCRLLIGICEHHPTHPEDRQDDDEQYRHFREMCFANCVREQPGA